MLTEEQMKKLLPYQDTVNAAELKGKRLAAFISEKLLIENNILTMKDNEDIYVFNCTHYEKGEYIIKEQAEFIGGQKADNGVISEAIGHIRRQTYCDRDIFTPDKRYLNLLNGVWDFQEMKLLPHSSDFKFNFVVPLEYNENANGCALIDSFFKGIVAEDRLMLLYEIMAYCLYMHNPHKQAFMLHGGADSGKTTYASLVSCFLGQENTSNVELQSLSEDNFATSRLFGKLANIYDDLPAKPIYQTGTFKSITGNGIIEGQEKFKGRFSFKPFAKLLFATNQVPRANDEQDAYFDRWIIVNFPNCFRGDARDNMLLDKLTQKEELQALLKKCLLLLPELLKNNFSYPLSSDERRALYVKLSDPAGTFLEEKVEFDPSMATPKEVLYGRFVNYCKEHKQAITSEKSFSKAIYSIYKGISEGRLKPHPIQERVRCWVGLSLINEEGSFTVENR